MNILYYNYVELPLKVRIKSNILHLDYSFDPSDDSFLDLSKYSTIPENNKEFSIEEAIILFKTGLFDEIYLYIHENMKAYITGFLKDKNSNDKLYIKNEWIKVSQIDKAIPIK